MKKIRIGVVGVRRGNTFVSLFSSAFEETEVTAVCEIDKEYLEKYQKDGKLTDSAKVFYDYDEMLDSDLIDAVVLANFFHEHADYAMKAMEKGIAVLSETTAAPSLGKCVDLVETAERTNGRYMLATNAVYKPNLFAMKKYIEDGSMGKVISGNAEYWHASEPNPDEVVDENNVHWRKLLPATYYNMHTLGPLMYVTDSVPVKVSAKVTYDPEWCAARHQYQDNPAGMVITEMDNGAVFNTTGCNNIYPTTKWYRLACEQGALETVKFADGQDLIVAKGHCDELATIRYTWTTSGIIDEAEYKQGTAEKADRAGHGGVDYFIAYYFVKYMKGEFTPFFDVYRSAILSAAGILGWYSVLSDGKEYPVPDFSKKEDRDKVRGDYRMPFAKRYEDITLPCRVDKKHEFTGCDL